MNVAVIIPAAGLSERFKHAARAEGNDSPRSKLDEELGGRPVLHRTVELFTTIAEVTTIIVAGPDDADEMDEFRARHADKLAVLGVTVIAGDPDSRARTVRAALAHVPQACTHVAVHDAARPGVPPEMLERIFDGARTNKAVIPALPIADTVKRVTEAPELTAEPDPLAAILADSAAAVPIPRRVTETLDRTGVVAVQTPQVFERAVLERAYEPDTDTNTADVTDDAALVERLGEPVLVVEGDIRAMKITTPADLRALRAILGLKGPAARGAHNRF